MKKFPAVFSDRYVPVLLLAISILGFGLLLPWLGFYWDDWAKILVARLWGLQDYVQYYAEDRPLSSWTHMLFTPLLGTTPLPWHIFTLLLRWLSAWEAWWCLNLIWSRARRQNLTAALIFLVHPVFVSQPAAVTFHQQWLQYALFFLSFGLMLSAQRARTRRGYLLRTGGSLLAMLAQLSVTEYFVPLELLRPLGLYFMLRQPVPGAPLPRARETLRAVFMAWLPYLLLTLAFTAWRLFFIRLPDADPYRAETLYNFLEAPAATLRQLLWVVLADVVEILGNAWQRLLALNIIDMTRTEKLIYLVSLIGGAAAGWFLYQYAKNNRGAGHVENDDTDRRWLRQALIFGLAALLLGPVPAWITGRQVVFDFHSDRYAMPAMFGAGVLFAVAVDWLVQKRFQYALVVGIAIAFAISGHLKVADDYRWIWTNEQRFFWELSWRAPGLKTPTALYMEEEPFPNQGLFSISAALNLMYPQGDQSGSLDYWMYTLRPRYNQAPDTLNISMNTTFRTLHYEGQTPDTLLLYKNPNISNCLWVLNARDVDHPYLPELVKGFLPISNLDRIDPQAARPGYPPTDILGPEPEHSGWCYAFEKADLARQQEDWAAAAALAEEALAQGYSPDQHGSNSPYEWMPMIEGLARSGRQDLAADLTLQAYATDAQYRVMLCKLWDALPSPGEAGETVNDALLCGEVVP